MTTFKITLKPEPRQDGKHIIRMRFTSARQSVYVQTSLAIPLECWNEAGYIVEKKKVIDNIWVVNYRFATIYNERIEKDLIWLETVRTLFPFYDRNKLKEAYLKYLALEEAGHDILEVELIPKPVVPDYNSCFLKYAAKEIALIKNPGTRKNRESKLNKFKDYINKHTAYQEETIPFAAITNKLFREYRGYLETVLKNKPQTIIGDFNAFNKIFSAAIKDKLLPESPLEDNKIKLKKKRTKKERPKLEELASLNDLRQSGKRVFINPLNVFFTQFYLHGARVGDVITLKWEYIKGDRIEYISEKNEQFFSIKITPSLQDILAYYSHPTRKQGAFIFPYLKDNHADVNEDALFDLKATAKSSIDKNLKKASTLLGLSVRLASHMARYCFADVVKQIARDKGKDMMGHSSDSTTDVYFSDLEEGEFDEVSERIYSFSSKTISKH